MTVGTTESTSQTSFMSEFVHADEPISTADAMLAAWAELDVEHIFVNLGTDHPGLIEAFARREDRGLYTPEVIICPHEFSALSAAQGAGLVSGKLQVVVVHTDVGTSNLGAAVHNVRLSRVPVLIFAGLNPYSFDHAVGARDTYVNFLQDVQNQSQLLAPYVKWAGEIRDGYHAASVVGRAAQIAMSEPRGPVYLTCSREALQSTIEGPPNWDAKRYGPVSAGLPSVADLDALATALTRASRPLLLTSRIGATLTGFRALENFTQGLRIPTIEMNPPVLNLRTDSAWHGGYDSSIAIRNADLIIIADCIVPWIPLHGNPPATTEIFIIDEDPLHLNHPYWSFPATRTIRANAAEVLSELWRMLGEQDQAIDQRVTEKGPEPVSAADGASFDAEAVLEILEHHLDREDIVIDEAITNSPRLRAGLTRTSFGTRYANGGTGLGWAGGGAFGAKLSSPDKRVFAVVGDGSYYFGVPSAVNWMMQRYESPVITIILNNGGWNATKVNLLRQYPEGASASRGSFHVGLNLAQNHRVVQVGDKAHWFVAENAAEFLESLGAAQRICASENVPVYVEAILEPIE